MRTITFTKEEVDGMLAMCKKQYDNFDNMLVNQAQASVLMSKTGKANTLLSLEGQLWRTRNTLMAIQTKLSQVP